MIRQTARTVALAAIAVVIVAATATALAESYRSLYEWALTHQVPAGWATIWPLMVDTFLVVGELTLFVLVLDNSPWWTRLAAWASTIAGLSGSVAGNVGHVWDTTPATEATHAVPPLAAAAALAVGLGLLKRLTKTGAPAHFRWPAWMRRRHLIRAAVTRYTSRRRTRRERNRVRRLGPLSVHRWITPAHPLVTITWPTRDAGQDAPETPEPGLPPHQVNLGHPAFPARPTATTAPRTAKPSGTRGVPPTAEQMNAAINAVLADPTLSARQLAPTHLGGNRRAATRAIEEARRRRATGGAAIIDAGRELARANHT